VNVKSGFRCKVRWIDYFFFDYGNGSKGIIRGLGL
jgi:hypothetical protein